NRFDRLAVKLTNMGGLVEGQLAQAVEAMTRPNGAQAQAVIKNDARVNQAESDIEALVHELIQLRLSPEEARQAAAGLQLINELERIGDLAKNIAKRSIILAGSDHAPASGSIARMGRVALRQLSAVLNAMTDADGDAALAVWGGDEHLDGLYSAVFLEVLECMRKDPLSVTAGTHMVFIAKNLERVGDHVTNMAEQIYFQLSGDRLHENRPKGGDLTALAKAAPPQDES
ncbi:MAG: phosphate signaling complex protein PhoU, partial [Parvularculaceae bacterium]